MLAETRRRLEGKPGQGAGENDDGERLVLPELLRADVVALPLRSGAIAAVHAGAAMHCWPQLEASLAEVHRVLKPGGRFFATTFYKGAMGGSAGGGASQPQPGMMRMFADEGELESLLAQAGFTPELTAVRREGRGCAIIRAEKA